MTNKAALVTGAGRRVGRAIVLGLAERGFDIALHYRRAEEDAQEIAKAIEAKNRKCVLIQADLFSAEECIKLIREAMHEFEGLELLVNNASIFNAVTLTETTSELFDQNFALHVRAPLLMMREFAQDGRKGHVVNITDTMASKVRVDYFAYLLSKKSMVDLTEMAAKALAPNIRVNAIAPGSTMEPIDEPDSNYMQKRAQQVPLKLPGNPRLIVQAIDYLHNAPTVTGQVLYVDSGAHIED